MFRPSHPIVVFLCIAVSEFAGITYAERHEEEVPVIHDEFLEYDIRWGILSVGKATMSHRIFAADADGMTKVVDRMSAQSHGWVSLLKKIDNMIQSTRWQKGDDVVRSEVDKKLHQGSFRQDDLLSVDMVRRRATWENRLRQRTYQYALPEGVKDYVALVFDLRQVAWTNQMENSRFRLIMDRSVHDMTMAYVTNGWIKTAFGRLPAVRVAITSSSPELFAHNKPGDVWIAAEAPVILSMEAKTPVGDVRTVLRKWSINGADALAAFRANREE